MTKKILKYLIYHIFYPVLLFFGADKVLRQTSGNRRLIIMYHGVTKKSHFHINGRHLPSAKFERQLQYFKRHFDIVSLAEICEMKLQGKIPHRHTIALTFDDGFLNNLETALPMLEKYDIPATFFISSASLFDKRYMHPSDLTDLIRVFSKGKTIEINSELFKESGVDLVNIKTGINAYTFINSLSFSDWKSTLSTLHEKYPRESITKNVDAEAYEVMDNEDVRLLRLSPLASIGSHSHLHVNLTTLSVGELKEQLVMSKKLLEKYSMKPVDAIAFPNGYYNSETINAAKLTGYKYLIAAGSVEAQFSAKVFPRIGVLSATSLARNIISINKGFGRFGF